MTTPQSVTSLVSRDERFVLKGICWKTYESLLRDHADRSAPRFTYDGGVLEVMTPFSDHELFKRAIEGLVDALADALGKSIRPLGSTTFKRKGSEQGFEADSAYYLESEGAVRHKRRIDPGVDPPPDLVLEVEVTRPILPKLPILERFGVPEVWRFDGERVEVLVLGPRGYSSSDFSRAFPGVTADALSTALRSVQSHAWSQWMREAREWARQLAT